MADVKERYKSDEQCMRSLIADPSLMRPCPFCGCAMGVLFLQGGWRWYGFHKEPCILDGNPSGSYGRLSMMLDDWNSEPKDYEQKPQHRQKKVQRKVVAAGRK